MAKGFAHIPASKIWQDMSGLERVLRAALCFVQGEKNNGNKENKGYYEEAKEVRKVGEERIRLFEEAGREGEGKDLSWESGGQGGWVERVAVEKDTGYGAEASEGIYADGRAVFREDREYAAYSVDDNDAAAWSLLFEQREVPWDGRHRRVSRKCRQSGYVQWRDERGELPQDERGEETYRCGRWDVWAELQEACWSEEGGKKPLHHGNRAGRPQEVIDFDSGEETGRLPFAGAMEGRPLCSIGRRAA